VVKEVRFRRMKELGIVDEGVERAPRLWFAPRSIDLTPAVNAMLGRKMEIYASMVEYLDKDIGRLFDYLKEIGEYENTVIIFLSDNGAEGNELRGMLRGRQGTRGWLHALYNFAEDRPTMWGRKGTYAEYGPGWATAAMTPFRLYKGFLTEGGIRSPLIVSGPGVGGAGTINDEAILHVMDIAPTMLELAGIDHPDTYEGREVLPMQGKSMLPLLQGKADFVRDDSEAVAWELFGRRALRQGRWKVIWLDSPFGGNDWELFDLGADPSERNDLAETNPEKLFELVRLWEEYADSVGVVLPLTAPSMAD
jgi:arylsulfatase